VRCLLRVLLPGIVVACAFSSRGQESSLTSPDAPLPPALQTVLPAGTYVHLLTAQTISSKNAKAGEVVELEVMRDVKVRDLVVIPQHTRAFAAVALAQPSRRLSRAGSIALELKSVKAITGDMVPIRATKTFKGEVVKDQDILQSGYLLFLPVILSRGEQATVRRGTVIDALVERDVPLDTVRLRDRVTALEIRSAANRSTYATAHIYRHAPDVSGGKPKIYLDGVELARMHGDRYLNVMVDAGSHSLRTDKSEVVLDCKAGEDYYVRVERKGLGMISPPKAHLSLVPNEQGEEEIYALEALNRGDIRDRSKLAPPPHGESGR